VFVDESGLSERPHPVRTWAPRGQTPVLQYSFNWKCLSAIAGITIWNFYFRLFPGSIKAPQVIQFLEHLQRHISGPLTVIWDGCRCLTTVQTSNCSISKSGLWERIIHVGRR
jgi:hypothetical protein